MKDFSRRDFMKAAGAGALALAAAAMMAINFIRIRKEAKQ